VRARRNEELAAGQWRARKGRDETEEGSGTMYRAVGSRIGFGVMV